MEPLEMTLELAGHITDQYDTGKRIDAIKELRAYTNMGLKESKDYLERYYHHGKLFLFQQICSDFVMSTEELLASTIRERDLLNDRIAELQSKLDHPTSGSIDNIFGKPKG